jgi:thioredoxin-dependent peroxiredoxin
MPLLADTDKKVAEAYGVYKEKQMYGKTVMGLERTTFIIGKDGKIKKIFLKVKVDAHIEEVLKALDQLRIED